MTNRVDCIRATNKPLPHQRILALGGTRDSDGQRWRISQREIVGYIEAGCEFVVFLQGQWLPLRVATDALGHKYVKTDLDPGLHPNSLMALDELPAR